jgi:colanic acid/amylovoran biosynthesis glycosyltransferase
MMTKKILYIVSLFPCWSETFIVGELHALKEHGFDILIFSLKPHQEELVQETAESLWNQVNYPSGWFCLIWHSLCVFLRRPILNILWFYRILVTLGRHPVALIKSLVTFVLALDMTYRLRHQRPDRIHAHWATYPSTAAMIMASNLDTRFSFTSHAHDIFREHHLLTHKLQRADVAITISHFNVKYLHQRLNGRLPKRPEVVHCGVNLNDFAFMPAKREGRLIVSVGRLDEIKGFRYLIGACKVLADASIDVECRIIGQGEFRPKLEEQIQAVGLTDRVILMGTCNQQQVREWVKKATLFVLPSVQAVDGNMDGIPVALMEAMALGTPVISTRVSGIPELIEHQVTGLLSEPGNVEQLANDIRELLARPDYRHQLALAARQKVEAEFNCRKEAEKLARLFGGTT